MKKIRLDFSPVTSVTNILYKGVDIISVNGGGGMGGSREEIFCTIVSDKT